MMPRLDHHARSGSASLTAAVCTALLASALPSGLLGAQVVADSAPGFAIVPGDDFSVHRTTNRRQFDIGYGIRAKGDTVTADASGGYLCEAGFKSAPQNASLTREQINTMVDNPDWRNVVRANMNLIFEIVTEDTFTLQGYRGVELTMRPKGGAGGGLQVFMSMIETARGRTTMVCNSSMTGMATALTTFRTIRQQIRLPE
jgi:hypothetical protein